MGKKEFTKRLDEIGENRIRYKIVTQRGRIVDVVAQYETLIDGKWVAVVRYDCAHGFFHRDVLSLEGEKRKDVITIQDLENSLLFAEQDLKDRWEMYKEDFVGGKK